MNGVKDAGSGVVDSGRDALGLDHRQRLPHLVREQHPPGTLRKLIAQRQTGQRIEGVVQIDQQLAPLHALDVIHAAENQLRLREQFCDIRIVLLQQNVAGGGAMKMAVAEGQNIERHHPRQHIMIRQRIAQHADVAGAVLKTDDHRILPSMLRDQVRDLCGVVALDRDEDDIRVRKNRRRDRRTV